MNDAGVVTLVTGAASGIGAAVARHLSAAGQALVLVDVDTAGLERVASSLASKDVAILAGDIAEETTAKSAVALGERRFGQVDRYHFNAGIIGSFDAFPDVTTIDFDRVMGINVRGTFFGLRQAFRQFARQQSGGAIVVTASIASLRGSADVIPYQTSKHAVMGLVHGAAMYGGPLGVRTNAVAPGLVPTELHTAAAGLPGGGSDIFDRGRTVPLRRTGTPAEVASVVGFLLSDGAAYVNGEVVSVDGGSAIMSSVRPSGGAGKWDPSPVDAAALEASARFQIDPGS